MSIYGKKHSTKNAQLPGQGEASLLLLEGVSALRQMQPPHDHQLRVRPAAAAPQLPVQPLTCTQLVS